MSVASDRALAMGRQLRWRTFEERFAANVKQDGECLVWVAGTIRGYGYIERDGAKLLSHRVAFEREHGPIPVGMQVDHICRNRSCVRPSHLRLATNKSNAENKPMVSTNTSGYRGVTRHRDGVRWVAQVKHNQRNHYLGIFDTAEAAGEAARIKRVELFTHNDSDRITEGHRIWPEVAS